MSYSFLEIIFDEDYTEDNNVLDKLKAALTDIAKIYLVTSYDNGAKFVVHERYRAAVVAGIENGGFRILEKSTIKGTENLLMIIKPERNDFADLDDKRLKDMWS